jgi:DNA replication protein DnaC
MDLIKEIIKESIGTPLGISRFQYMPYSMDVALDVFERIGKSLIPKFRVAPEAEDAIVEILEYFHGDPQFEGDLNKGLLLLGPTGSGKSMMLEIMKRYRKIDNIKFVKDGKVYLMDYEIIDVRELNSKFLNSAFEGIDHYGSRYCLCLDDIGSEPSMAKHYGNDLDVFAYIISERARHNVLTFGTSNLPLKDIETRYDDRTFSRLHQLFNFIIFKGPDYRKL